MMSNKNNKYTTNPYILTCIPIPSFEPFTSFGLFEAKMSDLLDPVLSSTSAHIFYETNTIDFCTRPARNIPIP